MSQPSRTWASWNDDVGIEEVEALGDVDVVVLGELSEPVDEAELALESLEVETENISSADFVAEDANVIRKLVWVRLFVELQYQTDICIYNRKS